MHLFTWLSISVALPIPSDLSPFESLSRSQPFEKLTHSLSSKELRNAVKKAPERLRLGPDDFLYSGLKRKSVAGAYGTSAAVALGGVAITYQGMNMRTKNRDAETKKAKDAQMKKAICAALKGQREPWNRAGEERHLPSSSTERSRSDSGSEGGDSEGGDSEGGDSEGGDGGGEQEYAYPSYRSTAEWDKRALSDATLNTIEDYNKMIGATEAIASGSIAMLSANHSNLQSLEASKNFYCDS